MPNLSRSISEAGTSVFEYEGFRTVDPGKRGNIPVQTNPTKRMTYEPFLRKIFYKNKIRTHPKLFNNIEKYFNFITTNKRVLEGRELMKNFKPDPDVLYLLDPNKSKLSNTPKGDIFSSFGDKFKTSYENYKYRIAAGEHWKRNAKIIEDMLGKNEIKRLTGSDNIRLAMAKERRGLKQIFDYSKLPKDLQLTYAMDHSQGLSAAAQSGNKNLMRLAVTDLIGSTVKANTELGRTSTGQQSFESKRSKLVQAIVKGDTSKLKELNDITEKAYGKKNVYKIANGELISSRISSAKDASGRYKQYIEKIANISVAKKEIIKQAKINPELKKIVNSLDKQNELVKLIEHKAKGTLTADMVGKAGGTISKLLKMPLNVIIKAILPFLLPGPSLLLEGIHSISEKKLPAVTGAETWLGPAFWADAMTSLGVTKNTLGQKILRAGLSPSTVAKVSRFSAPALMATAAVDRGRAMANTFKKAEALGIDVSQYVDRSSGVIEVTDELYDEIRKRESGQGMDYFNGGIASLR